MSISLYKARGVPTKGQVCAICVDRTRGRTTQLRLEGGVSVWLCSDHGSEEFLRRRNGRDFVLTLHRLWSAHGCLTKARGRALDNHLRALRQPGPSRRRPGSYSWPALRHEAESRFRDGEDPGRVIADLRARHSGDYANAPSVRTMRRWFAERRWLSSTASIETSPDLSATGGRSLPANQPLGRAVAGHLSAPRLTYATSPETQAAYVRLRERSGGAGAGGEGRRVSEAAQRPEPAPGAEVAVQSALQAGQPGAARGRTRARQRDPP